MSVSTDLAKVCARENAMTAVVAELKELVLSLPPTEFYSLRSIVVDVTESAGKITVEWRIWHNCDSFRGPTFEAALDKMNNRNATRAADLRQQAEEKTAEAAKLLAEAAKLDGGEK